MAAFQVTTEGAETRILPLSYSLEHIVGFRGRLIEGSNTGAIRVLEYRVAAL